MSKPARPGDPPEVGVPSRPSLPPIPSPPVTPATPAESGWIIAPATLASIVAVILVFGASVLFGLANSGFLVPSGGGSGAQPSSALGAGQSPALGSSAIPAIGTATPSPLLSDEPTTAPTPTPTPATTPKPTSNRFALLTKCAGKANCWIYRIRSGDNLYSIANYFGVSLDAIKSRNPWTQTEGLKVGRQLFLPTPTR
jgi:LysM repeat protein